ncbi:MAG: 50S ribosomal protein L31e [Candidatus Nitrosocosmicus sp.]
MSNVEETVARIYTINFGKAWLTPKHRRTDRVVNMIKEFAIKHMKSSQIKIDQDLNRYIWQKGKTNPPRKVRVRIVKDEDDQVIVSLYEDIIHETSSTITNKEKDEDEIRRDNTSTADTVNDPKLAGPDEKNEESSIKSIGKDKDSLKQNKKKSNNKT